MSYKKSRSMELTIKGIVWKVTIQSPASYKRAHGSDSAAITYPEDREIFFQKDFVRFGTVIHEIFHCYVSSCNCASADLKADQVEENIAEMLEFHVFDLLKDCQKVIDFLAKE